MAQIHYTVGGKLALRGGKALYRSVDFIADGPKDGASAGLMAPFGRAIAKPDAMLTYGGTNAYPQSMTNGQVTSVGYVNTYGFSIPITATIRGILVEMRRNAGLSSDTENFVDNIVSVIKSDGSLSSANRADTATKYPLAFTYASYGGFFDLWGESWTYSDINNANFGAGFSALATTAGSATYFQYDHLRITVHYSV